MIMEESILKTAKFYNKVIGHTSERATFHRLMGKIMMYEDVKDKLVKYEQGEDGRIREISFGEDIVEV